MSRTAFKKYAPIVTSSEFLQSDEDRLLFAKAAVGKIISAMGREDRIVWALRQLRVALTSDVLERENDLDRETNQAMDLVSRKLREEGYHKDARFIGKMKAKGAVSTLDLDGFGIVEPLKTVKIERFVGMLQHYVDTPSAQIQKKVYGWESPHELINELRQLEADWRAQYEGQSLAGYGTALITFEDGSAWFDLERGGCPQEAESMGHCGNGTGRHNETLLSYRKPVPGTSNQWVPHLTFVLDNSNGCLGEMKGRANDMPAKRYHKVIKALLDHDRIKDIASGGYMDENNFQMDHLELKDQIDFAQRKPELFSLKHLYDLKKQNDVTLPFDLDHYAAEKLGEETGGARVSDGISGFYYATYGSLKKAASELGANNLENTVHFSEREEPFDIECDIGSGLNGIEKPLSDWLSHPDNASHVEALHGYLERAYKGYIQEHDLDLTDVDDWLLIAKDHPTDGLAQILVSATQSGLEVGASDALQENINSSIENLFDWPDAWLERVGDSDEYALFVTAEGFYEVARENADEYNELINDGSSEFEALCDLDFYQIESVNDLNQPHYGYEGFSEETAAERLNEALVQLAQNAQTVPLPLRRTTLAGNAAPYDEPEPSMNW